MKTSTRDAPPVTTALADTTYTNVSIVLIYSDIKGVPFRLELETEFTPSDESLKQGRNRSWLL